MTELVPGQNIAWPELRATVYLDAPTGLVFALPIGTDGRGQGAFVGHECPALGAAQWLPGPGITIDLTQVADDTERYLILTTEVAGPVTAQALAASGAVLASFSHPCQPGAMTALMEIYRRGADWKIRAVGQHFASPTAAAQVYVVPPPAASPAASPAPAAAPTATAATAGPTEDEIRNEATELARLCSMILDDASRSAAAFQGSREFAERQLAQALETIVGDPALRGPAGDPHRARAQAACDDLVQRARAAFDRDMAQLSDELASLDARFPAEMARWESAQWSTWSPLRSPMAIRVGELSLPDAPQLRVPMLVAVPSTRPLWIEIEPGNDQVATSVLATLLARAVLSVGALRPLVTLVDIGASRGSLGLPGDLLKAHATSTDQARDAVAEVREHVSLLAVAAQSGAVDEVDPEQRRDRLLVVTDFPTGLAESTVAELLAISEVGPYVGVQVLLTGTASKSLNHALLEQLFDASLRLPCTPGGDIVDGFAQVGWTFHPDPGPADPLLLLNALQALASRSPGWDG